MEVVKVVRSAFESAKGTATDGKMRCIGESALGKEKAKASRLLLITLSMKKNRCVATSERASPSHDMEFEYWTQQDVVALSWNKIVK